MTDVITNKHSQLQVSRLTEETTSETWENVLN
jgi:hypothetical protein